MVEGLTVPVTRIALASGDRRRAATIALMWSVLLGIAVMVLVGGFFLWLIWPARTGAVAAGERGNDGLIPSSGDASGGGVGPSPGGDF